MGTGHLRTACFSLRQAWAGFREEHEALGFIPGVVEHTSKPNTWEVEAEGSEIQGCSQLSREFEANLGYVKL